MEKGKIYLLGVDYGTASVRAAVVDAADGTELASGVFPYQMGVEGCLLDSGDPLVARQHPRDYIRGLEESVKTALAEAKNQDPAFSPEKIRGLGIDTTGTTVLPVLRDGTPLVETEGFQKNLNAHIWLWKDHSSWAEAEEITQKARGTHPEYLDLVGGAYSSEWYWAKVLHCLRADRPVYDAAFTWMEVSDWLLFRICGGVDVLKAPRGVCAAGHKALFSPDWGGYPSKSFITILDPALEKVRATLDSSLVLSAKHRAGTLSSEWKDRLGLSEALPVAMPAFDAHFGGVGAGIKPGVLVKTIGTSTCDLMVSSAAGKKPVIPGMAGIVLDSIVPGYYGIEAGQSAVGDIFNWFVKYIQPCGKSYGDLSREAQGLLPGESGLLSLDWHNGNRTILVDQQLTGLILGLNLQSSPGEIYRCLIEATAFGARVIQEQAEKGGLPISEIVVCGGIPRKDRMITQIYADILGKPLRLSRNSETCALGGAIAASVAGGVYPDFEEAMENMTATLPDVFLPNPGSQKVYNELFPLYMDLHDAFSASRPGKDLGHVMKRLLEIQREAAASKAH